MVIAGCIATAVVGALVNYFGCAHDKVMIGKLIAVMGTIGYTGSVVCWQLANKKFN